MMDNINRKRIGLNRTLSEQPEGSFRFSPTPSQKYQTASANLYDRWRSFKKNPIKHSQVSNSPPPVDDVIVLGSYVEEYRDEVISVTVCRDMIYKDLIDLMKSKSGKVQLLYDIESSKITPENIAQCFQNTSRNERNVAALWAILFKRSDLIPYFISVQVDLNFYEPRQGFGALHISGFSGCTACTQILIDIGADVNRSLGSYTPLHCAAFGNSVDTTSMLLRAGANMSAVHKGSDRFGCNETPLHSAVRAKAMDVIQFLLSQGADINNIEGGTTPLHIAADLGYYKCLKLLLESGRANPNVQTLERKYTPIHFAAEGGYIECVKLLLQHGGDPNITNFRKQTALHVAAKVCLESVQVLLADGKCDPNALDADNRTPLHVAVSKSESEFSFEITDHLIKWHSNVNSQDKYGYTPLHMAALNDLTDCVNILIDNNADVCCRTKGSSSVLGVICKRSPTSVSTIRQKLDDSLTLRERTGHNNSVLQFNFRYLLQSCQKGEMTFIKTFVDEGLKELLEHPLCEAFLYLKWQKIRKYYIARLIFYLLFVILLSVYVLLALSYQCYNTWEFFKVKITFDNIDNKLCHSYDSESTHLLLGLVWYVLIIFTIIEIIRKIHGMCGYVSLKEYISRFANIADVYVLLSVVMISFKYGGKTREWQNHVGAIAVLLGWTNLMIMVGHLPMFGAYITMYTRVQKEFTKLLLAYSGFLIGFSICFCVIFPQSEEFRNPFSSIVKILVMMTGELEFNDLKMNIEEQKNTTSGTLLKVSSNAVFTVFLVFVTVILMNLLIGIAVHDIQGLKQTADLSKLVDQANLISQVEESLFRSGLPSRILKVVRWAALVAPVTVVLTVKLLHSQKCIPTDIMRNAMEVCKRRRRKFCGTSSTQPRCESTTFKARTARNSLTGSERGTDMFDHITKLTIEVQKLREMVETLKRDY